MNIVIMAGGGGTRLWPVSREKAPKQFTALVGTTTMLQQTYERAMALVRDPRRILVTTRAAYAPEVYRQLPKLPRPHVLVEAVKRDTAPSIGMAAAYLAAQGRHDEPLIQMASDHVIRHEATYRRALRLQGQLLRKYRDRTVLLGAEPTYPETGLGYIERRSAVERVRGFTVYTVRRFTEKPSLKVATRYVRSGRFFWNMSIYGWCVGTLLELFHRYQPEIARRLDRIEHLFATGASARARDRIYLGMPSISIDYAITEHQDPADMLVIPGSFGWSDVGHWASLAEVLGGTVTEEVRRGNVVQVKARGNFVYCDAPVVLGLVGVQNLIAVATERAILICDKENAQDVKALVAELERRGHHEFL